MRISIRHLPAVALIALFGLTACGEPGPSVVINGKTYTESDLKSQSPSRYESIRDEYNKNIYGALQQMGTQKLFELEAEEKGQSIDEYMGTLRSQAKPPSEQELLETYNDLKATGQISTESYPEVRDRIAQFLMGQQSQEIMGREVSRLKEKYGYRASMGPVQRKEVAIEDDPYRLQEKGKVTIIEFSDFECPFCTRVQATASRLREKYGDQMTWVVKDFPLSFHENAMQAHVAANCVLAQDKEKYWAFFDGLFAEDRPADYLAPEELNSLAARVGADMKDYSICMSNPDVMRAEIEKDIAQGEAVGVRGTPAFFINGRFVSGALPYEDFESIIEEELN